MDDTTNFDNSSFQIHGIADSPGVNIDHNDSKTFKTEIPDDGEFIEIAGVVRRKNIAKDPKLMALEYQILKRIEGPKKDDPDYKPDQTTPKLV